MSFNHWRNVRSTVHTSNSFKCLLYILQDVYKIQNDCRGKVFVINNVDFHGQLLPREASNKDADNLTKLFTELHFTVIPKTNLTAQVRYE